MIVRPLVIACLALALAGCGGKDEQSGESIKATATGNSDGEKLFAKCTACHTIDKGGHNGIGPNLHGIVGRAVASGSGFNYSAAMKAKGGNWDEASLDSYIDAPAQVVPGNKMMFAGIKDAAQRKVLIDYLKAQK